MYKKTNPDIFVVDKMNGADPDEESQKKIVSIDDALTIIGKCLWFIVNCWQPKGCKNKILLKKKKIYIFTIINL